MELFTSYKSVDPISSSVQIPVLKTYSFETPQGSTKEAPSRLSDKFIVKESPIKTLAGGDHKNSVLADKLAKAADYAMQHKENKSTHNCASYVSNALEAVGLNIKRRDGWKYNDTAKELGMHKIVDLKGDDYKKDTQTYKKGDVIVTHKNNNSWGHVAICNRDGATLNDSTAWISDFTSRGVPYSRGVDSVEVFRAEKGGIIKKLQQIRKGAYGMTFYESAETPIRKQSIIPYLDTPILPQEENYLTPTRLSDQFQTIEKNPEGSVATLTTPEKDQIVSFFMNKGLSKAQASGIYGNLMHESNLNIGAIGDKGSSRGIAQWHDERKNNLDAYEQKHGSSLDSQLEFLWGELNGSEKKALEDLKKQTTVEGATKSFMTHFERPKKETANLEARIKYALS